MADKIELFIKILRAEIEDLNEDLLIVENKYKEKYEKQDIGNFVYQENEALLMYESQCVSFILKQLEAIDFPQFVSIDLLIKKIRYDVRELVKKYEYPESVTGFIDRKIDKVKSYIDRWSS